MKLYGSTQDELIQNANVVKEQLLLALESEGLLTKPAAQVADTYAVVVTPPGILGKLFRKIIGSKPDVLECRVMKLV